MNKILKLLFVEDSEDDALLTLRALNDGDYEFVSRRVETADALQQALMSELWDIVLSDYSMPQFSGFDALSMVQATGLDLPFIIVSGAIGEERAVEFMRAGARDYVMKDNLKRLVPIVQRELREADERRARRKAEEQVIKLSRALEQSASIVMITDTAGVIEYVNHAFTHVTGYLFDEVVGMSFPIVQSGSTPPEIYDQLWNTILAGDTWRGELQNKKKNDELYWVEATISCIKNQVGDTKQFLVVQEDITERKLAEEALRESERNTRNFQEYLKTLHDITMELSRIELLDDLCRMAVGLGRNRLGFDRMGLWLYDPETELVVGTYGTDRDGNTADEREIRLPVEALSGFQQIFSGKQELMLHNPTRIVTFEGDELATGWIAHAALWDGDHVIGYISTDNALQHQPVLPYQMELLSLYSTTVGHLLTRKRSEIALRESEKRYRNAITATGLVPYVNDYREKRFTFIGEDVLKLTGYTAQEVTPRLLRERIQEEYLWKTPPDFSPDEARQLLMSGVPMEWHNDFQLRTRSGEIRWISDASVPITDELGRAIGAIGIFQDITERKAAESALRRSEAQLRALLDATPDDAFLMSLDGSLLTLNETMAQSMNRRVEELVGRNVFDLLEPEISKERSKRFEAVIQSRQPMRWEDSE